VLLPFHTVMAMPLFPTRYFFRLFVLFKMTLGLLSFSPNTSFLLFPYGVLFFSPFLSCNPPFYSLLPHRIIVRILFASPSLIRYQLNSAHYHPRPVFHVTYSLFNRCESSPVNWSHFSFNVNLPFSPCASFPHKTHQGSVSPSLLSQNQPLY